MGLRHLEQTGGGVFLGMTLTLDQGVPTVTEYCRGRAVVGKIYNVETIFVCPVGDSAVS